MDKYQNLMPALCVLPIHDIEGDCLMAKQAHQFLQFAAGDASGTIILMKEWLAVQGWENKESGGLRGICGAAQWHIRAGAQAKFGHLRR